MFSKHVSSGRSLLAVTLIAVGVTRVPTAYASAPYNEITGAVWVSGSNSRNQQGIYGTLGVPHPNNIPGSRQNAVPWIDASDNLWLFGGWGYAAALSGRLNDLWTYDPLTGNWTWMSGSDTRDQMGTYGTRGLPHPDNVPGARQASVSWTDSAGDMWLFGGEGFDSLGTNGYLSDLWKYDPQTGNWTWVAGPNIVNQSGAYGTKGVAGSSNVPGARQYSIAWPDSNHCLWLFGGVGFDGTGSFGNLSDLWKFDTTTDMWTWVAGPNIIDQLGVYGTQGVPDPNNIPGSRAKSTGCVDEAGNLWLFGGSGYDGWGSIGRLNDLWVFEPATVQWTWISGSDSVNLSGHYGPPTDPLNMLGARSGGLCWMDSDGILWLFGGYGYDDTIYAGSLNDLWYFDPATGDWTWEKGSYTRNQNGTYGTKGVPSQLNMPGGREIAVEWIDSSANLWLFGGLGYGGGYGSLNDLWKFERLCKAKTPGDLSRDCKVNFLDFAYIADNWLADNTR